MLSFIGGILLGLLLGFLFLVWLFHDFRIW